MTPTAPHLLPILELHGRGVAVAIATHSDAAEYGLTRDALTGAKGPPWVPRSTYYGDTLGLNSTPTPNS